MPKAPLVYLSVPCKYFHLLHMDHGIKKLARAIQQQLFPFPFSFVAELIFHHRRWKCQTCFPNRFCQGGNQVAQSWPMEPEKIPGYLKERYDFLWKTDQPKSMSMFHIGCDTFIPFEPRTLQPCISMRLSIAKECRQFLQAEKGKGIDSSLESLGGSCSCRPILDFWPLSLWNVCTALSH